MFGIPIGLLGAGFEEVIEAENDDDERELVEEGSSSQDALLGTQFERSCYNVVNGFGSTLARAIETSIYILIFTAIIIGTWQTCKWRKATYQGAVR